MTLRIPALNDAKAYPFGWFRAMLEAGLQPGAIEPAAHRVTAAAAGGQRLDIAAGHALVKGTSGTPADGLTQGLYLAVNDAAVANAVTLPASNASLPRVDRVFLRVNDSGSLGSAGDTLEYVPLAGTPTAGATLDNASGAQAATLANALLIADVLVPAGSTATAAGNVRDRRPWARGFASRINASAGDIPVTTSGVGVFGSRCECTPGNNIEVGLMGQISFANASVVHAQVLIDNLALAGTPISASVSAAGATELGFSPRLLISPTSGSRVFGWFLFASVAGGTARANASQNLVFYVREVVGPNTSN